MSTTNRQSISSTETQQSVAVRYLSVRNQSERICDPLETEDYIIQTMPDVSPPKWHLAHTSWFFETFLLKPYLEKYEEYDPLYATLFNSYYTSLGKYHPRPRRGLLSRPTIEQVYQYRKYVDDGIEALLGQKDHPEKEKIHALVILGINHEQQHQELMLTDIKNIFYCNPVRPVYENTISPASNKDLSEFKWNYFESSMHNIGYQGDDFSFDNEKPTHQVYVNEFYLADRPVSNGEFLEFIEDGGYCDPQYWLSDGWVKCNQCDWQSPLYWEYENGQWQYMTLSGMQNMDMDAPVCHVSFYEADAYARWAGMRLPTEIEWEVAALNQPISGNFQDKWILQPDSNGLQNSLKFKKLFGDIWEWTSSAYSAYPGYHPAQGALGEYNGKFMSNQMVLRGGSCATPSSHIRPTYRNFFYPYDRWQFTGIRLAKDYI